MIAIPLVSCFRFHLNRRGAETQRRGRQESEQDVLEFFHSLLFRSSLRLCVSAVKILFFLTTCIAATALHAADLRPVFPPSPRLATTVAELAADELRPDFAARKAAAIAAAEKLLAEPPALPEGFGSWTFYYACADDGTDLRALSPAEHECPKCKKRYADERTVAAYRCRLHYALDRAALQLAWGYAYTKDERFASGVRRILLHLAEAYKKYPARQDRWGRTGWFAPLGAMCKASTKRSA